MIPFSLSKRLILDQISLGSELQQIAGKWKSRNGTLGFVPTMGALHSGHLSLIDLSAEKANHTVCSIFVNPTQFNDPGDFNKYPRTIERDKEVLMASSCDILFTPEILDIYPGSQSTEVIDYGLITSTLEAALRPGHFDGVVAVLRRLFTIVNPDFAFFGEKDFQQLALVKELCKKEFQNIQIVSCPIIREESGLAMSSRNERLSTEARKRSAQLYQALLQVKENWSPPTQESLIRRTIIKLEFDGQIEVEYLTVIDAENFSKKVEKGKKARILIAAWMEGIRLIDNIPL